MRALDVHLHGTEHRILSALISHSCPLPYLSDKVLPTLHGASPCVSVPVSLPLFLPLLYTLTYTYTHIYTHSFLKSFPLEVWPSHLASPSSWWVTATPHLSGSIICPVTACSLHGSVSPTSLLRGKLLEGKSVSFLPSCFQYQVQCFSRGCSITVLCRCINETDDF